MIELDIERPVAGGDMLARHDGKVVFVSGALPGERVRAAITRTRGQVSWAQVREVIAASPDRREVTGDPLCGGRTYAHVRYERQLELKAEVIGDAFRRIAKHPLTDAVVVVPSPESGYRLRARLHVAGDRLGFSPGANPNMGRGYEAAWAEFEKTRGDYRAFAEARAQLRATAFAQAFGKVPRNAEEQWDALLRKEPSEQITALNILREHSPETIVDLKRWKIRQVANNMFDFTEAGGKSPVSVDKFINELTEGNRLVGAGFWSPREKEALRGAIAYARMIENKAAIRAPQPDPEGMVMAAASRSVAFIARAMYRVLGQGKAEELFFTPRGSRRSRL